MTGNETGLERSPETPLTLDGFSRSEHSPVPTFIPTHSPAWLGLHIATGSKGRALSRAGLSVLLNLINPRLFFFFSFSKPHLCCLTIFSFMSPTLLRICTLLCTQELQM